MLSFLSLCVLLGIGHLLRTKVKLLHRLYVPSSVVAGLLGLVIVQAMTRAPGEKAHEFIASATAGWSSLPGFLINIVFACLFIGVAIPPLKTVWKHSGPQLAYGQIVAWGQYAVGIGVFLVGISYLAPELPAMFGGILPVGFEGGHGTAGGLGPTFDANNWSAGKDFALASATVGLIGAVIVGMILVNWAVRRGHVARAVSINDMSDIELAGIIPKDKRAPAAHQSVSSGVIGALTLHLVIVGFAMLIGYVMREGLRWLGAHSGSETFESIMAGFPLFPLCMLGGLIVQLLAQKFDDHELIDTGISRMIMNASLDFLVVAAITTIRVEVLYHGLVPFILLMLVGIAWNVFCVVWLARRSLPDAWFERSIAEMGQSMGVTATGVLLLRVVDPEYETSAPKAFAYKQLLHEPFMGGGLWTSTAIPLLALWGGWPVFGISMAAVVIWGIVIMFMRRSYASA